MLLLAAALDALTREVSGSPVTYLISFVAAGGDVLLPLIPSETILITAGVVAARGHLNPVLLVLCAALGAVLGDNVAYVLGDRVGEPIVKRVLRGEGARRRVEWSERAIRTHGALLVLVGRFIPGGRTAATLAAGLLQMPWKRRFLPFDALAATIWAVYVVLLGYEGGAAFEDSTWKPLLLALGIAVLVAAGIEVYRRIQRRRGKDILGDELQR